MYGNKIFLTGLTFIFALPELATGIPAVKVVGAVLCVLGIVLVWLDK